MYKIFKIRKNGGFSLTELIIAMLLGAILSAAAYNYFKKQKTRFVTEKLSGDVESISRVAFYLIGRDIRRAGSNPSQAHGAALSGEAAVPLSLTVAEPYKIQVVSDLNADGNTDGVDDLDEVITYQFFDCNGDGVNDCIKRDPTYGNLIVIANVIDFKLSYIFANGDEFDYPDPKASIKKVRIKIVADAGRLNPETGQPIRTTFETVERLRNFQ
jgi:prepilin-type N-terminal cleavage/methylation domain-containing protein